MRIKSFLSDFVLVFVITFVVTGVVTFCYSFIAHQQGVVDWDTAFIFAISFGIALPLLQIRHNGAKEVN